MKKNKQNIEYTTNYKYAYKNSDIIIIGVETPEKKNGSADLTAVFNVCKEIAESIESDTIVIIKSTVPIGTSDKVEKYLNDNVERKIKVDVVSNPEFLAQGTAVRDTLYASRIVIGTENDKVKEKMKELYKCFNSKLVFTDRKSAEMIKYASNDFLALKISYINEIANLCEKTGANIEDVSHGMGLDSRIGNKFLKAGIGYGGSCFPKDTKALHWLANTHDYELKTIKAAIEVNENQKIKLIEKARKYYDSFEGLNIAVLGLTFKPETDDIREAPSLVNIPILIKENANIKAWDPIGVDNFKRIYPNKIKYCNTIEDTIKDTDICFIFTEWEEIKEYSINKYTELMKKPIIIDGRNCYNLSDCENILLVYDSIGRKCIKNIKI